MVGSAFDGRTILDQLVSIVPELERNAQKTVSMLLVSLPFLMTGNTSEVDRIAAYAEDFQAKSFGNARDNYREVLSAAGLTLLQLPRVVPMMGGSMGRPVMLKTQVSLIYIADAQKFHTLLTSVPPRAIGGDSAPANRMLQWIAGSIRSVLATMDFAEPQEAEFEFLLDFLPKLAAGYSYLGVDRWSSYFQSLEKAKEGKYLREFLLVEAYSPNSWVKLHVEHWIGSFPFFETVYAWNSASESLVEAEKNPKARQLVHSVSSYMARVADQSFIPAIKCYSKPLQNKQVFEILLAAYETIRDVSLRTKGC
jgi:hypothetical protein